MCSDTCRRSDRDSSDQLNMLKAVFCHWFKRSALSSWRYQLKIVVFLFIPIGILKSACEAVRSAHCVASCPHVELIDFLVKCQGHVPFSELKRYGHNLDLHIPSLVPGVGEYDNGWTCRWNRPAKVGWGQANKGCCHDERQCYLHPWTNTRWMMLNLDGTNSFYVNLFW